MQVVIRSLLEGARAAEGVAVIIDVYRAMTTVAVLLAGGVRRLYLVADVEAARRQRDSGRADFCAGEVDGIPPAGFDFGNSPNEVSRADLAGRTVVLSTRAGTTGMEAAARAVRRFAGAFVNAAATAAALRSLRPPLVTLVAMGWNAGERTDEDEECAAYLRDLLEGRAPDAVAVRRRVLAARESQKFGDPARPWFRREDRDLALDFDRYDFAVEVVPEDGLLVARKNAPPAEGRP